MEAVGRRRFRVSVRSLMIAVAVSAMALVPFLWVARQTALVRAQRCGRGGGTHGEGRGGAVQYVAQVQAAQAQLGVEAAGPPARPEAGTTAEDRGGLWAALAVNHAAFRRGEAKGLYVEFTLVNDGDAPVDPKVGESRIVVDGVELADSGLILGNGPRDARFAALPPGDTSGSATPSATTSGSRASTGSRGAGRTSGRPRSWSGCCPMRRSDPLRPSASRPMADPNPTSPSPARRSHRHAPPPPAARPMRRDRLGRRVASLGLAWVQHHWQVPHPHPLPLVLLLGAMTLAAVVCLVVGAPARRHRPPSPRRPAVGGELSPAAAGLGVRRPLRPGAVAAAAGAERPADGPGEGTGRPLMRLEATLEYPNRLETGRLVMLYDRLDASPPGRRGDGPAPGPDGGDARRPAAGEGLLGPGAAPSARPGRPVRPRLALGSGESPSDWEAGGHARPARAGARRDRPVLAPATPTRRTSSTRAGRSRRAGSGRPNSPAAPWSTRRRTPRSGCGTWSGPTGITATTVRSTRSAARSSTSWSAATASGGSCGSTTRAAGRVRRRLPRHLRLRPRCPGGGILGRCPTAGRHATAVTARSRAPSAQPGHPVRRVERHDLVHAGEEEHGRGQVERHRPRDPRGRPPAPRPDPARRRHGEPLEQEEGRLVALAPARRRCRRGTRGRPPRRRRSRA